jgi:hypothetical protein
MPRPRVIEKRDRQLNIGVTQRELEAIRTRAAAVALHPVQYARAVLFRQRVEVASQVSASRLDQLGLEQLKRIGNNLNQIARQLNAVQDHSPPDLESALQELRRLLTRLWPDDR